MKTGTYKHFKGNLYEVLSIAKHSETREEMVVYRALYDEMGIWVRPLKMFQESVESKGKKVPRFEYVGNKKFQSI